MRMLSVCLVLVCAALAEAAGPGAETSSPPALTSIEQRGLAERFAPVLVFHPAEEYFPVNPLFSIEGRPRPEDHQALISQLGTAESRRDLYRGLTTEQKAELATVYFRAYPARRDSEDVIVLEYWLYYVQNIYRVRGNLLPVWTDGSHPNDLEHIHLVVRRTEDSGFALVEALASSHEGNIPSNRYRYPDEEFQKRGHFLVELGSHALAPDIDQDGVFTPGDDGDSTYKMLWGIRDHGITWSRYASAYMDPRDPRSAKTFTYAGAEPEGGDEDLRYRLVPVETLAASMADLGLTDDEREAVFETERNWFRRLFGGDNGSSEKLLVPPPARANGKSIGIGTFASTERGFLLGSTMSLDEQGLFAGVRYAHLHSSRYLPDLILETNGIVTTRTGYVSTQLLLSYPIDSTIKLMGGRALVTDSIRFDRRQWDWIAAIEIRLGRMRIYGASRSWGPITRSAKEFRLSYFF